MAYISVITDNQYKLVKEFKIKDGVLDKRAPGHLVEGTIETFDVDAEGLVDLVKGLNQHQCLCLGSLDTPEQQPLYCGKTAPPGAPTRSKEFLDFPPEAWMLLDFDESGKTPEEAIDILAEIDPQFKTCGLAVIPSSSSYLYVDGKELVGAGNYHIYVPISGNRTPGEYGEILFDRLILQGYVTPVITKAGSIVIKSLFDRSVLSPEREIFAADPVCHSPLESRRLTHAEWQVGPDLDADAIDDLDADEQMNLRLQLKEIRETLHEKSVKQRQKYYKDCAVKRAAQIGNTTYLKELPNIHETDIHYDKKGRPILELMSNEFIMGEDGNYFQVKKLLLSPEDGTKLPDPIEPFKRGDEKRGIPGKGVATVLGSMIYSHHHCGMIYLLKWTIEDLMELFTEGEHGDRTFVWKQLSSGKQELSSTTTEGELSELSDAIKGSIGKVKGVYAGKEKKYVLSRLKVNSIPEMAEVDKVLEMNAKYGVVNMGGKATIISENWNRSVGVFDVMFTMPTSLDVLTKNIHMKLPGMSMPVSLYKYWEQHPERRTFDSIVFEPNAKIYRAPGKMRALPSTNSYNMFQGYIYEPSKAKNCNLILDHIKEVWCSNDETEYNYVIGWLAFMFQHPEKLNGTSLVLQSVPGAGKGIIIENCIVKVLGIHAISTSNPEDLVGRFNVQLGMNIFFYANEMSYTAQTSVKSMLKTLVETESRWIEAKNVNKVPGRNHTSLIISTNGEWVLNIDHDDRRFVYLTVSSKRVGDFAYFEKLKQQIDDGGKDAFIKYLLSYDLSKYDGKTIPNRVHHQRKADFLRSAHPSIRFVWSLYDTDFGVAHFANDPSYKILKEWQSEGKQNLILGKAQFFSLYKEYCEYYKIDRKYDDAGSIEMNLENGGVLKRETDPRPDFIMQRVNKNGKVMFELRSVEEGKPLLRV